jgi:hypothetical protein
MLQRAAALVAPPFAAACALVAAARSASTAAPAATSPFSVQTAPALHHAVRAALSDLERERGYKRDEVRLQLRRFTTQAPPVAGLQGMGLVASSSAPFAPTAPSGDGAAAFDEVDERERERRARFDALLALSEKPFDNDDAIAKVNVLLPQVLADETASAHDHLCLLSDVAKWEAQRTRDDAVEHTRFRQLSDLVGDVVAGRRHPEALRQRDHNSAATAGGAAPS